MHHVVVAVAASAVLGLSAGAGAGLVVQSQTGGPELGPAAITASSGNVAVATSGPKLVPRPADEEELVSPGPASPAGDPPAGSSTPTVPTDSQFLPPASAGEVTRVAPQVSGGGTGGSGALPPRSGAGPRVVWAKRANHVWIVGQDERVLRDYPVTDLDWKTPVGQYRVLGRNEMAQADTEDGPQSLAHFVYFYKRCAQCSYIGFHAIPTDLAGRPIQPQSALGTEEYHSHGCIRQAPDDAAFLYEFADVGTLVVVVP